MIKAKQKLVAVGALLITLATLSWGCEPYYDRDYRYDRYGRSDRFDRDRWRQGRYSDRYYDRDDWRRDRDDNLRYGRNEYGRD